MTERPKFDNPENKPVALTFIISPEQLQTLSLLSLRHGITKTEELRICIETRNFLEQKLDEGYTFHLQSPDGTMQQIKFAHEKNPKKTEADMPDTFDDLNTGE